jgi:hypothetical protein
MPEEFSRVLAFWRMVQIAQGDALRGKCGLRGCLPIRVEAGRGGQGRNGSKEKQAQQKSHSNQPLPSL